MPFYQNILAFIAISIQTTRKYTYLFSPALASSTFSTIEADIKDVFLRMIGN